MQNNIVTHSHNKTAVLIRYNIILLSSSPGPVKNLRAAFMLHRHLYWF